MLISSLPPVHQGKLLKSIVEHPAVDAVRYNTGVPSSEDPFTTLLDIQKLTDTVKKQIWVDLKGKQLRSTAWTRIPEGGITLNHKIAIDLPARVHLRGSDFCELRKIVDGNMLYVDSPPRLVGEGQAVNVLGANLKIEGGLLDLDHQYIRAAFDLGITNFMLSFVESREDVQKLEDAIVRHSRGMKSAEDCKIVFKIESQAGVEFIRKLTRKNFSGKSPYQIMAARDDLLVHIGLLEMTDALKLFIDRDPNAICASRLFMGLDSEDGEVTMADVSDIELMRSFGYKNFMFSDGISRDHADRAMGFWQDYCVSKPFK